MRVTLAALLAALPPPAIRPAQESTTPPIEPLGLAWRAVLAEPEGHAAHAALLLADEEGGTSLLVGSAVLRVSEPALRFRLYPLDGEGRPAGPPRESVLGVADRDEAGAPEAPLESMQLLPAGDVDGDGHVDALVLVGDASTSCSRIPHACVVSGRSLQRIGTLDGDECAFAPTSGASLGAGLFAIGRRLSADLHGDVTLYDLAAGQVRRIRSPLAGTHFWPSVFGRALAPISSVAEKRVVRLAVGAPEAVRSEEERTGVVFAFELDERLGGPAWTTYGERPEPAIGIGYGDAVIAVTDVDADGTTDVAVPIADSADPAILDGVDVLSGRTGERLLRLVAPPGVEELGPAVADATGRALAVVGRSGASWRVLVYDLGEGAAPVRAEVSSVPPTTVGASVALAVGARPVVALLVESAAGPELRVFGHAPEPIATAQR